MYTYLSPFSNILNISSENFALLGLGLLVFTITTALYLCLPDCISRIFEAACDRIEHTIARRKARRRVLAYMRRSVSQQVSSAVKQTLSHMASKTARKRTPAVVSHKTRRPVDAQEALRRSCSTQETAIAKTASSYHARDSRRRLG